MPTETEIAARLRGYIVDNFLYMRPDFEFSDDDRLMERGIVDSMGVLEVLQFLEEAYGVSVDHDEISEANFGTVGAIARFVAGKCTASRAA